MLKRIITAVILAPLFVLALLTEAHVLRGFLAILSIFGMFEMYRAFSKINVANFLSFTTILVYYFFIDDLGFSHLYSLLIVYLFINMVIMVMRSKITPNDIFINIFGFLYIGLSFSAIYFLRIIEDGNYLVFLIFIIAWGSDTFAYFVGKSIGKHKLSPKLSPNKTVEGAIGGIVGAVILSVVYSHIFTTVNVMTISIIALFSAMFSQIGDLAASKIKRHLGVKDYGSIIPGHGGVIDRFDSVILIAPIVYILVERFL